MGHEWNRPNRTDHYLMQLGAEVRRLFSKNPASIGIDKLKIDFRPYVQLPDDEREELDRQMTLARMSGIFGVDIKAELDKQKELQGADDVLPDMDSVELQDE